MPLKDTRPQPKMLITYASDGGDDRAAPSQVHDHWDRLGRPAKGEDLLVQSHTLAGRLRGRDPLLPALFAGVDR